MVLNLLKLGLIIGKKVFFRVCPNFGQKIDIFSPNQSGIPAHLPKQHQSKFPLSKFPQTLAKLARLGNRKKKRFD